jgi:hypothetical protein
LDWIAQNTPPWATTRDNTIRPQGLVVISRIHFKLAQLESRWIFYLGHVLLSLM